MKKWSIFEVALIACAFVGYFYLRGGKVSDPRLFVFMSCVCFASFLYMVSCVYTARTYFAVKGKLLLNPYAKKTGRSASVAKLSYEYEVNEVRYIGRDVTLRPRFFRLFGGNKYVHELLLNNSSNNVDVTVYVNRDDLTKSCLSLHVDWVASAIALIGAIALALLAVLSA
jgi:hypothetical protein